MRIRIPIAVALFVIGVVWIGQGVGMIKGSFMTGQAFWAIMGGVAILFSLALLRGLQRGPDGPGPG